MVEFKYKLTSRMQDFISNCTGDSCGSYVNGYLSDAYRRMLDYCPLYILCNAQCDDDGVSKLEYHTPVAAIVAKSDSDAVSIYNDIFKVSNGTVLFEAVHKACNAKVEAV